MPVVTLGPPLCALLLCLYLSLVRDHVLEVPIYSRDRRLVNRSL